MATGANSKNVELDDLKDQFDALRADMKAMADLISEGVSERAADAKDQTLERATALSANAKETATRLQSDAERAVAENPLAAIAICAGIGFLLGVVARK